MNTHYLKPLVVAFAVMVFLEVPIASASDPDPFLEYEIISDLSEIPEGLVRIVTTEDNGYSLRDIMRDGGLLRDIHFVSEGVSCTLREFDNPIEDLNSISNFQRPFALDHDTQCNGQVDITMHCDGEKWDGIAIPGEEFSYGIYEQVKDLEDRTNSYFSRLQQMGLLKRSPSFEISYPDDKYLENLADAIGIVRDVVKSHNPEAQITTNLGDYQYSAELHHEWERVFDVIAPVLDIISINIYPDKNIYVQGALEGLVTALYTRYRKPVSIAELGLCVRDGRFSEEDQAHELLTYVRRLQKANPHSIFIYEFQDYDPGYFDECEKTYGLKRSDGYLRPAYDAVLRETANSPLGVLIRLSFKEDSSYDIKLFKQNVDDLARRGIKYLRVSPTELLASLVEEELVIDSERLDILDDALKYAKDKGIENLALHFAPPWDDALTPDEYRKMVGLYADAMASRVGDKVDIWQVFNEPNISRFTDYSQR